MEKLVVLELNGNFQQGFDATLEIREGGVNSPAPVRVRGKLPKNEDVRYNYQQWQQRYLNLEGLWLRGLKERNSAQVTNAAERKLAFEACDAAAGVVEKSLNDWLDKSEDFDTIREKLLRELQSGATIRVLLQTDDSDLRRLPWNRCHLLASAEVGLSAPEYDCKNKPNPPARKNKVRILAVLGYATDLPHQGENRRVLDELAKNAGGEIVWKEQPALNELNQLLSEQCWDILFFSGHSESNQEGKRCEIQLTKTHRLSVTEIRVSLKKAMAGGLRLAIFNSCDGLGLAHQLAAEQDLYLPQVIVMREKVPDAVSPKFLRFFLSAFTAGDSLYASMWEARGKLREECDKDYPCASWMPVICQNPAIEPATWLQLQGIPPCPYRGLSAFRETDAPFFFGRERFAKQLLEAVRENALVPVIGASGLGKSSVVFAGLIPLLRQWDSSEMPVRI
nr:CHAT domain-containing protein [Oscillatoria sp. Prado101]